MPQASRLEIETAWAAGFYEGEGCIAYCRGHLMLTISQVNREPLDRFYRWAGTGTVSPMKSVPINIFRSSGLHAQHLAVMMWPHLSARRQDQILRALVPFSMRQVLRVGCQRGHPESAGFYIAPDGGRECLACRAERRLAPAKPFSRSRAIELRIGVREYVPPDMPEPA